MLPRGHIDNCIDRHYNLVISRSEKEDAMNRNYKPVDWSNFPPVEERTNFGDTNDNKLDVAIDEYEQAKNCAALAVLNAQKASRGEKPIAKAI